MSGTVRPFRSMAFGCVAAAALFASVPARADVTPLRAGDACTQWSPHRSATCRTVRRPGVVRTAMVAPQRVPIFIEPLAARYTSFLILGVGF